MKVSNKLFRLFPKNGNRFYHNQSSQSFNCLPLPSHATLLYLFPLSVLNAMPATLCLSSSSTAGRLDLMKAGTNWCTISQRTLSFLQLYHPVLRARCQIDVQSVLCTTHWWIEVCFSFMEFLHTIPPLFPSLAFCYVTIYELGILIERIYQDMVFHQLHTFKMSCGIWYFTSAYI